MTTELLITDLPRECIEDCGMAAGANDAAVDHWLRDSRVAPVMAALNRDAMRYCLKGFGAWDADELGDDEQNLARVLWLACGNFAEYIVEAEDAGFDPFGNRPSDFEPRCGSDLFSLE